MCVCVYISISFMPVYLNAYFVEFNIKMELFPASVGGGPGTLGSKAGIADGPRYSAYPKPKLLGRAHINPGVLFQRRGNLTSRNFSLLAGVGPVRPVVSLTALPTRGWMIRLA